MRGKDLQKKKSAKGEEDTFFARNSHERGERDCLVALQMVFGAKRKT